MHELGIAQEMLRVAVDYAIQNNASRITQFNVEMSAAADESEDSLKFHFEHTTRGTLAEGARVEIVRVPVQVQCSDCGTDFEWTVPTFNCPQCSSTRLRMTPHDEFKLTSIEVE